MKSEMDVDILATFTCVIATLTVALCARDRRRRRRRRRLRRRDHMGPVTQERWEQGQYKLFLQMKAGNSLQFFEYTRMNTELFHKLLDKVFPLIQNNYGQALPEELKLAMTLKYLSQGGSIQSVAWSYQVDLDTVSQTIENVCIAIWTALMKEYVGVPTQDEWKAIADGFWKKWHLPLCIGAIDGIMFKLVVSEDSTPENSCNIKLLAVSNDKYELSLVEVGASVNDGGFSTASTILYLVEEGNVKLPAPAFLPGTEDLHPFYFAGNEAFPLKSNLMRPYAGKNLDVTKSILNYRLSRGSRVIENALGLLIARWGVLHQAMKVESKTAEKIVLATVALHNFILKENFQDYCPAGYVDTEDTALGVVRRGGYRDKTAIAASVVGKCGRWGCNNAPRRAVHYREQLAAYLKSPAGAVPWQVQHMGGGTSHPIHIPSAAAETSPMDDEISPN